MTPDNEIPKPITREMYQNASLAERTLIMRALSQSDENVQLTETFDKYREFSILFDQYLDAKSPDAIASNPDIQARVELDRTSRQKNMLTLLETHSSDPTRHEATGEMLRNLYLEDTISFWFSQEPWLARHCAVGRTYREVAGESSNESKGLDAIIKAQGIVFGVSYTTALGNNLGGKLKKCHDQLGPDGVARLQDDVIIGNEVMKAGTAYMPILIGLEPDNADSLIGQTWVELGTGDPAARIGAKNMEDIGKQSTERAPYMILCLEEIVLQLGFYESIGLPILGMSNNEIRAKKENFIEKIGKIESLSVSTQATGAVISDQVFNELSELIAEKSK